MFTTTYSPARESSIGERCSLFLIWTPLLNTWSWLANHIPRCAFFFPSAFPQFHINVQRIQHYHRSNSTFDRVIPWYVLSSKHCRIISVSNDQSDSQIFWLKKKRACVPDTVKDRCADHFEEALLLGALWASLLIGLRRGRGGEGGEVVPGLQHNVLVVLETRGGGRADGWRKCYHNTGFSTFDTILWRISLFCTNFGYHREHKITFPKKIVNSISPQLQEL